jgi:3-methyladenine DNA glycosylase AlkD
MRTSDVLVDLRKKTKAGKAEGLSRFFKTAKGQYGYGDVFLGVMVPQQREVAKKFKNLPNTEITKLLKSKFHECRLTALFILVQKYKTAQVKDREIIFNIYISNTKYINNWDLVDLSAPNIVGFHLSDKPKNILYDFSKSDDLWKKRIAIIATLYFIARQNNFKDTLKISETLLSDKHDLIHKAVGWMLREVGKRDETVLKNFLNKHYKEMPRTALRYSIERFPEKTRKYYLNKK